MKAKPRYLPMRFILRLSLVLALTLFVGSCKLFKKKCDCPDHKRSKRIALEINTGFPNEPIQVHAKLPFYSEETGCFS
jgi:hypothetical protein